MIIAIDLQSSSPLYEQIADGIVRAIAVGSVAPGDRLPPGRELAAVLGVNLETVQHAYRLLAADGVVTTRVGRGTVVSVDIVPDELGVARAVEALIDAARNVEMPLARLLDLVEQRFGA